MEHAKRIFFLDTLRAFVITLVVFYHVTIHYAQQFQNMPFVQNMVSKEYNTFFLFLVLAVSGQLLNAIMFFIAGYFALAPLIKNGAAYFIKDKLVRLGIPYLFGLILLSPATSYIAARSWGYDEGFLKYWLYEFYKHQNITPFHLWFIGVLTLFFVLLSLVYMIFSRRIKSVENRAGQFRFHSIMLFIAVTTGCYFVVNQFYSAASFTNLYVINFQSVMLLVYAAYFLLGIHAFRKDWFKTGYKPRIIPWFITYVISIFLYLAILVYEFKVPEVETFSVVNLLLVLSFNTSILSAVFALLALFQRFADKGSSFARAVSKSSYNTYIFHYVVVAALIYASNRISLPIFGEYGLVLGLGILLSWGMGYIIVKLSVLKS